MRQGLCERFCYPFQTTKVDRTHAYHDTNEVDALALTPAALGSTGRPRFRVVDYRKIWTMQRHRFRKLPMMGCEKSVDKNTDGKLGEDGRYRRVLLEEQRFPQDQWLEIGVHRGADGEKAQCWPMIRCDKERGLE
jgi:hypothetical protein